MGLKYASLEPHPQPLSSYHLTTTGTMSVYRSALARAPRRIIFPATSRAYANASTDVGPKGTQESPPLPPPGSKPELSIDPTRGGVNTLVWVGALTAAAGGAYWYSTTSKGATEKEKAEARAREMKAKADAKGNELRVGHLLSSISYLHSLLPIVCPSWPLY